MKQETIKWTCARCKKANELGSPPTDQTYSFLHACVCGEMKLVIAYPPKERVFFECKECWSNGYVLATVCPVCPVCVSKHLTLSASEAEHMKKIGA